MFSIIGVVAAATAAFAEDSGIIPNNGAGSCPATRSAWFRTLSPVPGPGAGERSLANVPTANDCVYPASASSICGIAMTNCAFYIGSYVPVTVIVRVPMANLPANSTM